MSRMDTRQVAVVLLALAVLGGLAFADRVHGVDNRLRVHFIDVGHGDCIFIVTPHDGMDGNGTREGYRILIDAGDDGRSDTYVIPYLKKLGLKEGDTLDYVFATHAHKDHIGGMPEIYSTYRVNNTVDPGYSNTTKCDSEFKAAARAEGDTPGQGCWLDPVASGLVDSLGASIDLGSELRAQLLYYSPVAKGGEPNNTSLVLRLQYGGRSFLFVGDAETLAEKQLLARYKDCLKSTVLKVGHHGSRTSSSEAFLQAVQPEYAVVMAGCDHGLPDEDVLVRLYEHHCRIRRTDAQDSQEHKTRGTSGGDDNIVITTDGTNIRARGGR
jgi:beta-lactamase superfamily II metal-dependent hydrolase